MSETKPHDFQPPLYHDDARDTQRDAAAEQGREQQGWDAYRKWLKSINGRSRSRRVPIDHSVYSWKGYHSWADRVRQAWEPEES